MAKWKNVEARNVSLFFFVQQKRIRCLAIWNKVSSVTRDTVAMRPEQMKSV